MGELGLNKIFGALLATVLVVFGLKEVSAIVFPSGDGHGGGHHGEEHEVSLNEKFAERYAYYVEVAEGGSSGAEEEVFDLGLALASADPALGERAFKGKCVTCHTVEEGGANGTGPNLFGIMGAAKHAAPGFNYSSAMLALEGEWSYQAMNDWLENPAGYVRGTSMAFAGLRREDERANVIAYLASYSPDAPAFPAPLAAETDTADTAEELVEEAAVANATEEAVGAVVETVSDEGEGAVVEELAVEAVAEEGAAAIETVEAAADELVETADTTVDEAVEAVSESAEEAVEDAVETVTTEE